MTVPVWPTKWHTPPSVPTKAINADVLKPQGKMRKVELPDTLDLAELCGLSANVLIGNMDPHWQAYNFGVDPPRGVDRGAVLPNNQRVREFFCQTSPRRPGRSANEVYCRRKLPERDTLRHNARLNPNHRCPKIRGLWLLECLAFLSNTGW